MGVGVGQIAVRGKLLVAADAIIYYRKDLLARLATNGIRPPNSAPSDADLILMAYEAWGEDCPEHLEGDFAFLVWNEADQTGFAASDFAAARTLFFARAGECLALATSHRAVSAHPGVGRRLNLAHIGEIAAGFWAGGDETCYAGVRRLLPGHSLAWRQNAGSRVWAHWRLPNARARPEPSFEDGARILRDLLVDAVGERMCLAQPTVVWMSGGWDSTAVFGAGQEWLRRSGAGAPDRLHPVSMSYPEGDPGREDEWISDVADFWRVTPRWVRADQIPVLANTRSGAGRRDEPWSHPFEHWNRALASASSGVGATAVLCGNGGDQLFSGPLGQFSDLFWTGRWSTLRREWKERKGSGLRNFVRAGVLPGLPRYAYDLATVARLGRRLHHYLDRSLPSWFNDSFVLEADLMERQRDERRWSSPGRAAFSEMEFYFTTAYSARVSSAVRGFALDGGLDLRSPLLDKRVVQFAATRPSHERSKGLETKRLLRESVKGLLPENVLAPRPRKTGLTLAFFDRGMRAGLRQALDSLGPSMRLSELGIVDSSEFVRAAESYLQCSESPTGLGIYLTLQTEL